MWNTVAKRLPGIGLLTCCYCCIWHSCRAFLPSVTPALASRFTTARHRQLTTSTSSSASVPTVRGGDRSCIMSAAADLTTLDVLCLHGSGSDADEFERIVSEMKERAFFAHGQDWNLHCIQGPVPKGDSEAEGYAWWALPPGVRSFNATEYLRFDESAALVQEAVASSASSSTTPDLIVAHSQGSILITALLALGRLEHPRLGYILNGVAWPNPHTEELESLTLSSSDCRVLLVTGENDDINPSEGQVRVGKALEDAGAHVTTVTHPGGHGLPTRNDEAAEQMLVWVENGVKEKVAAANA